MSPINRLRIILLNFEPLLIWMLLLLIKWLQPELWLVNRMNTGYILGLAAAALVFSFNRSMLCYSIRIEDEKLVLGYYNRWGSSKTITYSLDNLDELSVYRHRFIDRKGQMDLSGPGLFISYRLFSKELFTKAKEAQQYVENMEREAPAYSDSHSW